VGASAMVLILTPLFRWFQLLIRSNFAFSKNAEDGFRKTEGFRNAKMKVLGTNY
jgi:hypothetical protein